MAKFVCVYADKKRAVYCDISSKTCYYMNNREEISLKQTLAIIAMCLAIKAINRFYDTLVTDEYRLIFFAASNLALLLGYLPIQKIGRRDLHVYYPSKFEFLDNMDAVKLYQKRCIVEVVTAAVFAIIAAVLFWRTMSFVALLIELTCVLVVLVLLFSIGLVRKKKLIRMIENREIP